ncbi:MAG: hypothetical protein RR071_01390 [Lachnospiraceae bacterium]
MRTLLPVAVKLKYHTKTKCIGITKQATFFEIVFDMPACNDINGELK